MRHAAPTLMDDDERVDTMLRAVPTEALAAAGPAIWRPAVAAWAQRIGEVGSIENAHVRTALVAC